MKCQEVGAEGPCSDAIAVGSGCLWEAALTREQEKPRHLWHCWEVNQSLGSLLLCWLLEGAQLTLRPMPTPAVCIIQAGAPSANSPGVQRELQTANATCLYKQPLYPPLGSGFFSLQNTSLSPHALGLLLEKLSDVERPGHDSPGCFWGQGAALGMAGPASSPWFQSITS